MGRRSTVLLCIIPRNSIMEELQFSYVPVLLYLSTILLWASLLRSIDMEPTQPRKPANPLCAPGLVGEVIEATASIDTATDNLIQQTIRQHFPECTVITIAHRITSVMDSNMVLLLDNVLVSEYDSPKRLLEDRSTSYAQLVEEYTMRSEF